MERNQFLCGDSLTVLKTLPDESVQCCVTSPPYFALRDYGVPGQIGMEPTLADYLKTLVSVFREVRRVLRPDGTCWLNIGDSYAATNSHPNRLQGNPTFNQSRPSRASTDLPAKGIAPGFKAKDLLMVPARLAIALQEDGWWLRSDIIWHKPTAMPESVTDRPTSAHEHIFLLAKSERYYYDADAIREPLQPKTYTTFGIPHRSQGNDALGLVKSDNWGSTVQERRPRLASDGSVAGANKRNVWTVASQPYPEAHFATFPPKLIEPCILAGSSVRACEQCGAPWQRATEKDGGTWQERKALGAPLRYGKHGPKGYPGGKLGRSQTSTVGWCPGCDCADTIGSGRCVVLDPFMGAGTTALVALQQGRDFLGIELNPDYIELAKRRIATVQPTLWAAV